MLFVEQLKTAEGQEKLEQNNEVLQVKFPLNSTGYFYQHDDFPSAHSAVPRALRWLSIAEALHAPVKGRSSEPVGDTTTRQESK